MAGSLSKAKLLSALVADQLSIVASRRGYSAAAQGVTSSGSADAMKGGVMMSAKKKVVEESSPWVPDPVTGYYRPENHANDVDVAELREMLLKSKISRNH